MTGTSGTRKMCARGASVCNHKARPGSDYCSLHGGARDAATRAAKVAKALEVADQVDKWNEQRCFGQAAVDGGKLAALVRELLAGEVRS